MKRFKKILFVNEMNTTDTSAPSRAVDLAHHNNAQLTLCDSSRELPRTMVNLEKTFKDIHKSQLMAKFEKLDLAGLKTETRMLVGTPFIEIIKEVLRNEHDLVIKSAEGSGGLFSNLFGETDMSLMRKCPCPVWINKPTSKKQYSKIIAAVDPDPAVPENKNLNKLILDLAISLARQENCELHIVHTWYLEGEDMLRSVRTTLSEDEVNELEVEKRKIHEGWLDDTLKSQNLKDLNYKKHIIKGLAGKVIPKMVKEQEMDLVVMGTLARTGIEGFFIGNTAESILRNVDCSVLTVKPDSFVTPVKA